MVIGDADLGQMDMFVAEDTLDHVSTQLAQLAHHEMGLILARTITAVGVKVLTNEDAKDSIKKGNDEVEHFLTQERTPVFLSNIMDGMSSHFGTEKGTATIELRLAHVKSNLDNPEFIQEVEEKNDALRKFMKDKYVLIKIGMGFAKLRKDMNASFWNGYGHL